MEFILLCKLLEENIDRIKNVKKIKIYKKKSIRQSKLSTDNMIEKRLFIRLVSRFFLIELIKKFFFSKIVFFELQFNIKENYSMN